MTGQYCCIAMEYFRAGHLGQKLTGALPVDEALRIARKVAEALSIVPASSRELIEALESARVLQSANELDFSATSA